MRHMYPSHTTSLRSILILSAHISISATFLAHLILRDLIILILFREDYELWSTSLCSFLKSPIILSLLSPNIPLGTLHFVCRYKFVIYFVKICVLLWNPQTMNSGDTVSDTSLDKQNFSSVTLPAQGITWSQRRFRQGITIQTHGWWRSFYHFRTAVD
jgi:hypothetical protein